MWRLRLRRSQTARSSQVYKRGCELKRLLHPNTLSIKATRVGDRWSNKPSTARRSWDRCPRTPVGSTANRLAMPSRTFNSDVLEQVATCPQGERSANWSIQRDGDTPVVAITFA